MKKHLGISLFLLLAAGIIAQQPQTSTAPISPLNAKYVQGVAPGYWPTPGSGLTLNLAAGTANCLGNIVSYAGGTLTMTGSTTNYVYLNTSASCAPAVKTSAFTSSDIPIASVVTGSSSITSITDDRTMFQSSASGGSNVEVNGGSALGTANLGGTVTPDSGYTLGTWKQSGNNVGVEVPSSSGNAVQFNTSTTSYAFIGGSYLYDDSGFLGAIITATAVSCTTPVCVITAPNTYHAGQWISIRITSSSPFMIFSPAALASPSGAGGLYQVLSAGLSSSQFEIAYSGSTITGTGGPVEDATYFLPMLISEQPFFQDHGSIVFGNGAPSALGGDDLVAVAAAYSTVYHSISPAVTGNPGYLFVYEALSDIWSCDSAGTIETAYQSLWSQAHADGWVIVQNTLNAVPFNTTGAGCPTAFTIWNAVNKWMRGQGAGVSTASCSAGINCNWDKIVDLGAAMTDPTDSNITGSRGNWEPGGAELAAQMTNSAMAAQGSDIAGNFVCSQGVTNCVGPGQDVNFNTVNGLIFIGESPSSYVVDPNIGIGPQALGYPTDPPSGYDNLAFGYRALANLNYATGSNMIGIGANSEPSSSSDSNEIMLGEAVTGAGSNTAVIGNGSVTDVYFGSATPVAAIHAAAMIGPASAPTGSCSGRPWVLSNGAITYCNGATWTAFSSGSYTLPTQYTKGSCTEAWGGSGTSNALTSGDDAVVNNTCFNDSGVTRTITAVKCRSDAASNTTTVNPTFGSAGTGMTIMSGALTCGNSYAYSSSGTISNASWTTGDGIDPVMGGTLTGTSIAIIVEYTF